MKINIREMHLKFDPVMFHFMWLFATNKIKKISQNLHYSQTSRKRTPTGPRVSVRLREVSAYGRVRKKVALEGISCTRTSILKL